MAASVPAQGQGLAQFPGALWSSQKATVKKYSTRSFHVRGETESNGFSFQSMVREPQLWGSHNTKPAMIKKRKKKSKTSCRRASRRHSRALSFGFANNRHLPRAAGTPLPFPRRFPLEGGFSLLSPACRFYLCLGLHFPGQGFKRKKGTAKTAPSTCVCVPPQGLGRLGGAEGIAH